jgi:AcrR family transcriptional regulator
VPASPKRNRGPSAGPANRRALIAAAREVFAERGYSAPLSVIARRAGVGQGSLYRHFPDRIALAVAVFDENIAELEAVAAKPDTTLEDFFDVVTDQAIGSTALIDLFMSDPKDPRTEHLATRVTAVAGAVLSREQAGGRISRDVTVDDIVLAISMLASVLTRTDPGERVRTAGQARRIFQAAFAPNRLR